MDNRVDNHKYIFKCICYENENYGPCKLEIRYDLYEYRIALFDLSGSYIHSAIYKCPIGVLLDDSFYWDEADDDMSHIWLVVNNAKLKEYRLKTCDLAKLLDFLNVCKEQATDISPSDVPVDYMVNLCGTEEFKPCAWNRPKLTNNVNTNVLKIVMQSYIENAQDSEVDRYFWYRLETQNVNDRDELIEISRKYIDVDTGLALFL